MNPLSHHSYAGLCTLILMFGAITVDVACAEPYLPSADNQILEQLPRSITESALTYLQARLTQRPGDLNLALNLAQHHIEQTRLNGDPRHLGRAEAVLAPWWENKKPPVAVLVMRAILRQANHEFESALADLANAIEREPGNAQAWLTRASIFQARGDYASAQRDCRQLAVLKQAIIADICQTEIASLSGNLQHAVRRFRQRLLQLDADDLDTRRWLQGLLADSYQRLGDIAAAEWYYRAAIEATTADLFLLTAYADFLIDQQRLDEVITLLESYQDADAALLRLVIAAQLIQHPRASIYLDAMQTRFIASRARGSNLHLREEARFTLVVLKQAAAALPLARANWLVQREPSDARILLEAALAAGAPEAAQPVLNWLDETGLEDSRLAPLVAALRPDSRGQHSS